MSENADVPESEHGDADRHYTTCWIWMTTNMFLLMQNVHLTKNSCIQSVHGKHAQKTRSSRQLTNLVKSWITRTERGTSSGPRSMGRTLTEEEMTLTHDRLQSQDWTHERLQ